MAQAIDADAATSAAVSHRQFVVATGAVLAVAVALAVFWLSQRTWSGGPLDGSDGGGIVVDAFPAGSSFTYGLQNLTYSGDDEITVESVRLVPGDPSIPELGEAVMAYGPSRLDGRLYNLFDVRAGWPPGNDAVPAAGARIRAQDDIGLELLVGLRVPSVEQGIGTLSGVTVTYRADGHRYRKTFRTSVTICPAGHDEKCDSFERALHS